MIFSRYVAAVEKVFTGPKTSFLQFVMFDECGTVINLLELSGRWRDRPIPGKYVLGNRVIMLNENNHK